MWVSCVKKCGWAVLVLVGVKGKVRAKRGKNKAHKRVASGEIRTSFSV